MKKIKIDSPKRLILFVLAVMFLVAVIMGGFIFWKKQAAKDPWGIWEVMVVLRSQEGGTPEEDARNNLKRGDAIAVREEGHAWSETEYKSYLLVKIEGSKSRVEKLLEPEKKKVEVSGDAPGENEEIVRLRRYGVDMEKIGFDGEQVISGQPVEDRVFSVEEVFKEKN